MQNNFNDIFSNAPRGDRSAWARGANNPPPRGGPPTPNDLQLQLATMQQNISTMEAELRSLQSQLDNVDASKMAEKDQAMSKARNAFEASRTAQLQAIARACSKKRDDTSALLNTFPDLQTKEYAGKYELKDVEKKLSEVYPRALIENYTCPAPITFETEGEAYNAYASCQRAATGMKSDSAGGLFDAVVSILSAASDKAGSVGKMVALLVGGLGVLAVVSPMLFITIYGCIAVCAAARGLYSSHVFRNMYSVKLFLNNAYDEDIFLEDKERIMEFVDSFLEETKQEYEAAVKAQRFTMNPNILREIDERAAAKKSQLSATISMRSQQLESERKKFEELGKRFAALSEQYKTSADQLKESALKKRAWKHEWLESILLDVTEQYTKICCKNSKCNTLYYCKDIETLQNLGHNILYQNLLAMHPTFAGQVVIDYKYNGGKLIPYSPLKKIIVDVCTSPEDIEKRVDRLDKDVRARCKNILTSCPDLDAFNKLMATYDSPGEAYSIVHVYGIKSFNEAWLQFIRNGPKVGVFFKFYLTTAELQELAKDFPYELFGEMYEYTNRMNERTKEMIQKLK